MATRVNLLTELMPKILARGLSTLRERCIMPRLVNSDYSVQAAQKGATIDIPVPVAVTAQDVAIGTVPLTSQHSFTPTSVSISLDQWVQNKPIALSDRELCEIDANEHFLPMQMAEAIKAIASNVNQFIFAKFKGEDRGVYGCISNPSDGNDTILDPFDTTVATEDTNGVSAATGAKKILNIQLCPRSDRRGVLNFNAEAQALDLAAFSDAEKIMSAVVKMEGEIGRKFGIDWVADDDVPDHVVGDAYESTPTNLKVHTTVAAGLKTLGIKYSDSTSYIKRGDIIRIEGNNQTYVVTGGTVNVPTGFYGYITATATKVDITIEPALVAEATGDLKVILTNSHAVNMVFHRDAFAFATRPLLQNSQQYSLGTQMLSMQDPVTGLILRLEVSRQHKQTVWEFDILYGADLVRPELAMRIAGAV